MGIVPINFVWVVRTVTLLGLHERLQSHPRDGVFDLLVVFVNQIGDVRTGAQFFWYVMLVLPIVEIHTGCPATTRTHGRNVMRIAGHRHHQVVVLLQRPVRIVVELID